MIYNIVCAATIIVNMSGISLNGFDRETLERAKKTCATNELYKYDTPCLKKFYKIEPREYAAICGGPENVDKKVNN